MKIDFSRLVRAARRAHEDEEGTSMVFGAMTLFTLALFTLMVYIVGINSSARLQNQSAADGAAYSGALVEAEALESIAFLNDGMAWVYYAELRYTIDAIVYSTLQVFHEHDQWVLQNASTRTEPTNGPTPGNVMEISVGGETNNPGATSAAGGTYAPGIEHGGSGTLDYSFVEMGSSGQGANPTLFEQRYGYAKSRYDQLVPKGRQWLKDIHWAERILLAAIPAMVKKVVQDIAFANGSDAVALSPIDQYFTNQNQGGGQGQDGPVETEAFTDGAQRDGTNVDAGLAQRYTKDKANPIDKKPRATPSWFDARSGQSTSSGYSQTRFCWNKRDWDHADYDHGGQATSAGMYDGEHSNDGFPTAGPNGWGPSGHWHIIHTHMVDLLDPITYQVQDPNEPWYGITPANQLGHDYGHGVMNDGGPDDGQHDPIANSQTELPAGLDQYAQQGLVVLDPASNSAGTSTHHMVQVCPTCGGNSDGTVTHTQQEAEQMFPPQGGGKFTVFDPNDTFRPRPIRMKGMAFRLGICVATWRRAEGFDAKVFPANAFGNLAVAAALIGLRDPRPNDGRDAVFVATSVSDQQVQFTNNRTVMLDSTSKENLYLGDDKSGSPGMRFGARLVPVANELTWPSSNASAGGAAARGLNNLVQGSLWQGPGGSAPPGDLQTALSELKKFVDVAASAGKFPQ